MLPAIIAFHDAPVAVQVPNLVLECGELVGEACLLVMDPVGREFVASQSRASDAARG